VTRSVIEHHFEFVALRTHALQVTRIRTRRVTTDPAIRIKDADAEIVDMRDRYTVDDVRPSPRARSFNTNLLGGKACHCTHRSHPPIYTQYPELRISIQNCLKTTFLRPGGNADPWKRFWMFTHRNPSEH
jgi:hypothetical protein